MSFTFGSDPEFMIVNNNGDLVSAVGVIKADADHRINAKGHQFYFDNVLAECAIAPSASRAKTLSNFQECMGLYAEMVAPHKLVPLAYALYPDSELQTEEARKVGCSPDKCAYKLAEVKAPVKIIENTPNRSGGGHIHLGKASLHNDYGFYLAPTIVLCDLFLGIPSLYIDHDPTSAKRREIYGQAGRYRIKDYGLEYRTLSNFWLASPKLTGFIYDLCEVVLDIVENRFEEFVDGDQDVYYSETPAKAYKYRFDAKAVREAIDKSIKSNVTDFFVSQLPAGLRKDFDNLCKPQEYDMYREWNL